MSSKSVRMESLSKILGFSFLVSVVPFLQNQLRQIHLHSGLPSKVNLTLAPEKLPSDQQTSTPEKGSQGVSPKELLVQKEIPKKAYFHR